MTRRRWRIAGLSLLLLLSITTLTLHLLRPPPSARLTLAAARYEQLNGWRDDNVALAVPALLRSCAAVLAKAETAPVDARPKGADFGTVAEWRGPCRLAEALPAGDDGAARRFFQSEFAPLLAGNNGNTEGLFTGYFEITLNGSRQRTGAYQTPLYRRPPEPGRSTRAQIEDGALAGKGLELLWVDDPIDAFFLEIQGSAKCGCARAASPGSAMTAATASPMSRSAAC